MNNYTVVSTYGDGKLFLTLVLAGSLDEAVDRFMETRPSLLVIKVLSGVFSRTEEIGLAEPGGRPKN